MGALLPGRRTVALLLLVRAIAGLLPRVLLLVLTGMLGLCALLLAFRLPLTLLSIARVGLLLLVGARLLAIRIR